MGFKISLLRISRSLLLRIWARAAARFFYPFTLSFRTAISRVRAVHFTKFVPFALETYGALSARSDRFLVECASLASRGCGGSGPSTSMLCIWFRQRVSIALQRSLAHAIHARFLRLEESMALLPPPPSRAPLSSSELHIVASLG